MNQNNDNTITNTTNNNRPNIYQEMNRRLREQDERHREELRRALQEMKTSTSKSLSEFYEKVSRELSEKVALNFEESKSRFLKDVEVAFEEEMAQKQVFINTQKLYGEAEAIMAEARKKEESALKALSILKLKEELEIKKFVTLNEIDDREKAIRNLLAHERVAAENKFDLASQALESGLEHYYPEMARKLDEIVASAGEDTEEMEGMEYVDSSGRKRNLPSEKVNGESLKNAKAMVDGLRKDPVESVDFEEAYRKEVESAKKHRNHSKVEEYYK